MVYILGCEIAFKRISLKERNDTAKTLKCSPLDGKVIKKTFGKALESSL